MKFRILITEAAISDIVIIRRWITEQAGAETAIAYTDRIEKRLMTLVNFPNRGTPRPDFAPGCRSVTFERRYLIVYRVIEDVVRIERVADGYRDWDWLK